jgi:hypothetical protein
MSNLNNPTRRRVFTGNQTGEGAFANPPPFLEITPTNTVILISRFRPIAKFLYRLFALESRTNSSKKESKINDFVKTMINNRIPQRVIQQVSGHCRLEVLEEYLAVKNEQVRGAAIAPLSRIS